MLNRIKVNNAFLEKFYFFSCILFTAASIWEVPYAVFVGPIFMLCAFVVYRCYMRTEFFFDLTFLCYAVFTVVYCCFTYNSSRGLFYQFYVYIQALFMFFIGCNSFTDYSKEEKRKYLEKFFLIISVLYFTYAAVTLIRYFFFTPHDLADRFYYSIWYDEVEKPATVISMSLVFPLTYGLYSVFFLKWPYKILGVIFDLSTIAYCIWSGTRTLVFVFPVLVVAVTSAFFIFVRKKPKTGLIIAAVVVGVTAAAICLMLIFKDNLYEKYHDHIFYRIIGMGFDTPRTEYALNVLRNFSVTYMGGGVNSVSVGTPHNIWLYFYDHGGFISFAVYCVFTVFMARDGIRMLFSGQTETQTKFLVFTVFSVIFVEYFLEPFILPLPSFYILSLFLMGLMTGEVRQNRLDKLKET